MSDLYLFRRRLVLLVAVIITILPELFLCKALQATQVDTLELQFQWAIPLSVTELKLVDFDFDGTSEIMVALNSDSSRILIINAGDQTFYWQSQGFPGRTESIGTGDRNGDGHLDIVAGGWTPDLYSTIGCLRVFNGPDFNSITSATDLDQTVTAVGVFNSVNPDTNIIITGTQWNYYNNTYCPTLCYYLTEGHKCDFNGNTLLLNESARSGRVQGIEVMDVNGDSRLDMVSIEDYLRNADIHGGYNSETDILDVWVIYPESTITINVHNGYLFYSDFEYIKEASVDAFAVGDLLGSTNTEVIVSWRELATAVTERPAKLSCFDAATGDTIWSMTDSIYPDYISGLAICELQSKSEKVICAAYSNGTIKFKDAFNGGDLIVSCQLPAIRLFAIGNLDQDSLAEICIATEDSIYVYKAPFITTDVEEPTADENHPGSFSLLQNYPNPFNPQTTIQFTVHQKCNAHLNIFNILGEHVKNFEKECTPGTQTVIWDGKNSSEEPVASGIYLYKLTIGDYQETRKMILLR